MPTLGAEIEKTLSNAKTGEPFGVTKVFFDGIHEAFEANGGHPKYKISDVSPDTVLGVSELTHGEVGLDNGRNLQETSTRIVYGGLEELQRLLDGDLALVQQALRAEGGTVINMSIHPLGSTSMEAYKAYVAPKSIYPYIWQRGWDHSAGIDAKAQNSPSTGVDPHDAARAVTTMIGAGGAVVGLFGNSPYAEGQFSGFKESRLAMWERMMKNSVSEGDRKTARFPEAPFGTLRDYFHWMFGPGTNIHFVSASGDGYKTFGDSALLIERNPSALDYLRMRKASAKFLTSGASADVIPHLSHLEAMQFAQFTGARIRYEFNHKIIDKDGFLSAMEADQVEELFANEGIVSMWIEGRDAGANFPDEELRDMSSTVAENVVIGPSALQAGLIANLEEAHAYIMSFPWGALGQLREQAMRYGLDGAVGDITVSQFARDILAIAGRGLPAGQHHMLAYAEHVLSVHANGADRAIRFVEQHGGVSGQVLQDLVRSRSVTLR